LVIDSNQRHFRKATRAMNDPMLPLPGLSPVSGKTIVAKFDGGLLSSDGGIVVLREVEQRLCVADCESAWNKGSDALLMTTSASGTAQPIVAV
jgi:hypothetical protein